MRRKAQITVTQHNLLCVQTYLSLLHNEMSPHDYVVCITSHSTIANERIYTHYLEHKINEQEFNEAKSIISKVHNAYVKKGNLYG